MMINNIQNDIGNINNIIANERRIHDERAEQLEAFKGRFKDENEDKGLLYNDLQGMDESLRSSYTGLMSLMGMVKDEVQANEGRRGQKNNLKRELKEQYKPRAKKLTMQLLNKYAAEVEREFSQFKQQVLNIEECKEIADGLRLIEECDKADAICETIITNYIRKMGTILKLVNEDVNRNNTKKITKLRNIVVD